MEEFIGKRLIQEGLLTEEQIEKALARQKVYGGRLGENLVALGFITEDKLKSFLRKIPSMPRNIADTGIPANFLSELILKNLLTIGEFTISDVSAGVRLPVSIVDGIIQMLRRERLVEVKSSADYKRESFRYTLTPQGRAMALELLDICHYSGPAPVPIETYRNMVIAQTIKNVKINEDDVRNVLSDLVLKDDLIKRIGLAASSGKSIFLYGPTGSGKTSIAMRICTLFDDDIYVPYALYVASHIITIFDPLNHKMVSEITDPTQDTRWVLIKRPVIRVGGEMNLKMLELNYNPVSKFYDAPLQIKANNGIFIVDDFGRQLIPPRDLLNRWIVPLDRRIDFLTLHTGLTFEIPFDQLIIFSTNIEPGDLVDEGFLRRIRYKIKVDHPSIEEYKEIFKRVCEKNEIEFREDVFKYLISEYYEKKGVRLCASHPAALIEQIVDMARYYHHKPVLSKETIDISWNNYFVHL